VGTVKTAKVFFDHLFFSLVVVGVGLGIGLGLVSIVYSEFSLADYIVAVLLLWAVPASGLAALLTLKSGRSDSDTGFPRDGRPRSS
jgi:hypothetical protein